MHLSLEQLLELRDGEAPAGCAEHVSGCAECAAELARLQALQAAMQSLPVTPPSRDLWPEVGKRARERQRNRGWLRIGWAAAGLATAVTLLVGVRGAVESWQEVRIARQIRPLVAESQRLEDALRASGREGRVVSGRTAGAIATLEDQIAVIDARLAHDRRVRPASEDIVDLWQERVRLLDTLVGVQTTRQAYVGL
jgi:hypothetical protein